MNSKLSIQSAVSSYNDQVMVLKVAGNIDATSSEDLKNAIETNYQNHHLLLLIDMQAVDYISSAGMGTIISMLKKIRDHGQGDIKLCSPKEQVYRVLESVGLHLIMEILEDESRVREWVSRHLDQPLAGFSFMPLTTPVCGQPFKVKITARNRDQSLAAAYMGAPFLSVDKGLVLPNQIPNMENGEWEGTLTTIDAGSLVLTISDGKIQNSFDLFVQEKDQRLKVTFPCDVHCPHCQKHSRIRGANIYQCKQCQTIFYIDAWAQVIMLKKGSMIHRKQYKLKGTEIKISSNVNYLPALREYLMGLAQAENIAEPVVHDLILVTEEVVMNIIEHAYDFDPHQIIVLRIHFHPEKIQLDIFDYGLPFDITKQKGSVVKSLMKGREGGVGSILINQLMDEVTYTSTGRMNQLSLSKRLD